MDRSGRGHGPGGFSGVGGRNTGNKKDAHNTMIIQHFYFIPTLFLLYDTIARCCMKTGGVSIPQESVLTWWLISMDLGSLPRSASIRRQLYVVASMKVRGYCFRPSLARLLAL